MTTAPNLNMNVSNLDNVKQRIYRTGWEIERKRNFEKRGKIMYIFTFQNEGSVIFSFKCIIWSSSDDQWEMWDNGISFKKQERKLWVKLSFIITGCAMSIERKPLGLEKQLKVDASREAVKLSTNNLSGLTDL